MRIGANNTLAGDHRQKNIREIRIFALYLAVQDKCVIRDKSLNARQKVSGSKEARK